MDHEQDLRTQGGTSVHVIVEVRQAGAGRGSHSHGSAHRRRRIAGLPLIRARHT